jgi:hypothetical protein
MSIFSSEFYIKQLYLVEGDLGEEHFGLIIGNGRVDNDIVTLVPVNWGSYAVFIAKLQS